MTRRKRIKISGTTPAEMELVEKIEQHLAIPLYDGVPGERLVLKPDTAIKQTAWGKNRGPKALTNLEFSKRYLGDGGMALMSTSPGRGAWAQMMIQKSIDQQNMLKEMYESESRSTKALNESEQAASQAAFERGEENETAYANSTGLDENNPQGVDS